jgi:hypothetical protein
MSRHPLDHDRVPDEGARATRYSMLERIKAGEGQHPKVKMLERRRKGPADPARIKHYLRIERGLLA